MSKLLIEEPPLQVLPSLALAIGLNEAIVLQQLHYLLRDPRFGKKIAEEQWIFNTVEQWRANYFPFWCDRTIKTVFSNLKRMNLIETCQPEGHLSRRQYYRINTEEVSRISEGARFAPSIGQDMPDPSTKTTSQRLHNTKGAQNRPYPQSEEEMDSSLNRVGITPDPDHDGDFFNSMTKSGWRINGAPVFDWIEVYRARLTKTSPQQI